MLTLVCRETGLDCDYVIKGETEEEFLKNGAEHVIKVHGMQSEDIYFDRIPAFRFYNAVNLTGLCIKRASEIGL